jgi:hypothetical protein
MQSAAGRNPGSKSRQQTHTALGMDPNHANHNMQLEDDQTDNQTVYLNQNRKKQDGAITMNLSQMSTFRVNQNVNPALISSTFRDDQGTLHASRETGYEMQNEAKRRSNTINVGNNMEIKENSQTRGQNMNASP